MRIYKKLYLTGIRLRMKNLTISGAILKKKQSAMYKNSKSRNFMLQMSGSKDGRLDSVFF